MQGILLINKPVGYTSFDVVAVVRGTIAKEEKLKPAQVKVGHTGTLDPLANGLLVLLIGKNYTRMATELTKLDKSYQVSMKLGEVTESADLETKPIIYSDLVPSGEEILNALNSFKGDILQTPPIYSALKVNGQRAYKLARQGKTVELKPRSVNILDIELIKYDYPNVEFNTKVSSGTYIRSLVVDLGTKLSTGAYMTDLKRTEVGDFSLKDALEIKGLSYDSISGGLISV